MEKNNRFLSSIFYLLSSFFISPFLLNPFHLVFASDCDWVESIGEAVVENITPDEARQLAINRARISAIESKTGVKVHGGTMVKDYNLMADVIQTLSQGYIIEEKVSKWEQGIYQDDSVVRGSILAHDKPPPNDSVVRGFSLAYDKPPLTTYKVKLSSCVAGVGEKDPYFKIEGKLNKPVFIEGDEAVITIKSSKDAYLNIFNLTAEDRVNLIAPSITLPIIPVKANKEFQFPPEGFGLVMSVIKDKKRSSECFIILATKEPYDFIFPLNKGGQGVVPLNKEGLTVPEFYRNIIKIPSNAKAEELLVYEVVAK